MDKLWIRFSSLNLASTWFQISRIMASPFSLIFTSLPNYDWYCSDAVLGWLILVKHLIMHLYFCYCWVVNWQSTIAYALVFAINNCFSHWIKAVSVVKSGTIWTLGVKLIKNFVVLFNISSYNGEIEHLYEMKNKCGRTICWYFLFANTWFSSICLYWLNCFQNSCKF